MAHKKAGGSIAPSRDSRGKRRGLKATTGQRVKPGEIIVRQCGTKFHPGAGVNLGRDYTIFAVTEGIVSFSQRFGRKIVKVIAA